MLKKIVLAVALVIVAALAYIASQPDTYRVVRTKTIPAPPDVTFDLVNDFENWDHWSPWDDLDPDMTKTLKGADEGAGAVYEWSGNDQAGEGRMTITKSVENERVVIDLRFMKPFESQSITTFDFEPAGEDATTVSWSMEGDSGFMMKLMSSFTDFDGAIGRDFEKGLALMSSAAKAEHAARQRAEADAAEAAESESKEDGEPGAEGEADSTDESGLDAEP